MSTLSTHVLDTSLGRPAQGITVTLEHDRMVLGSGVTDADGRVREIHGTDALGAGSYLLRFAVGEYFANGGRESFFPEVVVGFRISGGSDHYHIPLLLSPFGYSTYRGS